jgi:rhodanese-related sulfurtransferase
VKVENMPRTVLITIEGLLEMMINRDKLKLIDVLSEKDYKSGHIPGAINLPIDNLETLAKEHLEKSDTIVVYCGGYDCQASTRATKRLLEMGYEKTLDFKAGKRGWVHAGLELEK